MMADEEDVPIVGVFVERRLVGRARLEVVGAQQLHVVARFLVEVRTGDRSSGCRQNRDGKDYSDDRELLRSRHGTLLCFCGGPSLIAPMPRIDSRTAGRGTRDESSAVRGNVS